MLKTYTVCNVFPTGYLIGWAGLGWAAYCLVLTYVHVIEKTGLISNDLLCCQGAPVLEAVNHDECEYIFSWDTNLVCPTSPPVSTSDCTFTDPQRGYTFDFSKLHVGAGGDPYTVSGWISVCSMARMQKNLESITDLIHGKHNGIQNGLKIVSRLTN